MHQQRDLCQERNSENKVRIILGAVRLKFVNERVCFKIFYHVSYREMCERRVVSALEQASVI